MNKSIKNIVLALATIGISISSSYAENSPSKTDNLFLKAEKQLKNSKFTDSVEIGFTLSDKMQGNITQEIQRIVPLSNIMSQKSGMNLIIVPEKIPATFKNQIRAMKYPVLYVNPEMAVVALEMGYVPLYKTTKTVSSVLFARSSSQVNSWSDLYGVKVSVRKNTIVKTIADAAFYKTGTIGLIDYTERDVANQQELFALFDQGVDDILVLNEPVAKNFIDKNPGKFKIVLKAGSVPSFMVMVHPDVSESLKTKISDAFLEMNKPENSILASSLENDVSPGFVKVTESDFSIMKEVLKIVEPDYSLTKAPSVSSSTPPAPVTKAATVAPSASVPAPVAVKEKK